MALTDLLPIDRFIHPMPPVLSGTYWLAIHVPIIMVGYAVLALGVVVAHMQIGVEAFAPARRTLGPADGRAPVLVHPRRLDPARRRHPDRLDVGRLVVGPLLGLGPEGGLVAGGVPRLHGDPARAGRAAHRHLRGRGLEHRRLPDDPDDLPRRELRPLGGPALLRLRRLERRPGHGGRRRSPRRPSSPSPGRSSAKASSRRSPLAPASAGVSGRLLARLPTRPAHALASERPSTPSRAGALPVAGRAPAPPCGREATSGASD